MDPNQPIFENLKVFLSRSELKGHEVEAFNLCQTFVNDLIQGNVVVAFATLEEKTDD